MSDGPRLSRRFFDRPAVAVARDLLGRCLWVAGPSGRAVGRLVETEAYARGDPASHAYRGPTRRNRSMFAAPGTLYVYRIHRVACANLVCRRGEAVLLRAAAPVRGAPPLGDARGPGRLCRAFGLTAADDGIDATESPRVGVGRRRAKPRRIAAGPRIGISRAVDRPYRFVVVGSPHLSRGVPRRRGGGARLSGASPSRSRAGGR
ncbi:MAG: DNA-3-methyladenine glycosylase [Thermoplasmata archaeon]